MTTSTRTSRPSPYQGLIPYTEKDASFFFGREKETRLIIANLHASPLTILYGPSGVGKSSVLRAGVAYQLHQRINLNVFVQSDWRGGPLTKLKSMVAAAMGLDRYFDTDLPFDEFLAKNVPQSGSRLMIILDQFEEYFVYHPVEDEFTIQFSRAVMQPDSPVSFLVSIREDALAKLDRFEGRIPILFDNYLRLEHMDDTSARSAIEKPINKYNQMYPSAAEPIRIEKELVDEVLKQLKSGRVSLRTAGLGNLGNEVLDKIETPYLQLVMTRIWRDEMELHSRTLRNFTLRKLGGAKEIVRAHLDDVMNRLSFDHQMLASKVFQYLVTPSGTKIALSASDLASFVDIPTPAVKSLLQRLSEPDVRLLRAIEPKEKIEISYEIFHDVLALPILDWQARAQKRHMLRRRSSLLGLALLLISAIVFGIVSLALYLAEAYLGKSFPGLELFANETLLLLACSLPLLCLGSIFGIVGFVTGVNWARAK